jgi:hypothetical protein
MFCKVSTGEAIVIVLRLVVPLSIFRWPLAGGVASMLIDALDVVIIELLGLGGFSHYAALDKGLDIYYLSFEAYVALSWEPLAKWTAVALFVYRVIGFVAFEAMQTRALLLVFPNVFENFYLAYLALIRAVPEWRLTPVRLAVLLTVVTLPKLGQEYMLHSAEWQPWDWIKRNVLRDAWIF